MINEARRQQRVGWLRDRTTLEQVEKYIPTLTDKRNREIATAYLINMEPSGEIAARYGIGTHRLIHILHKIIRLVQHRVANNVDPADFDEKLRDEREYNYKLKTGMGYSKFINKPKLPKFLKRTQLSVEIMDFLYPIIVEQVQEAQDGAIRAMFTILDTVDDVEEARNMLKYVQRDMLEHREAFGKLAYEDEDGVDNLTTNN